MGVIVNNVRYFSPLDRDLFDALLSALTTLPDPELVPMETANIKQGEVALFMQREMLYIDRTNPRHTTRYVGTKSVDSCVIAYFYNDIEHLTIHFDHDFTIDLVTILGKLHDKQNLKLMLMGAGVGYKHSHVKVLNVIDVIYSATQELHIDIEITAQKLLERNKLTLSDKQSFLFDAVLRGANNICLRYFNCPIDHKVFSFDRVNEFKSRKTGKQPIDKDLLFLLPQTFYLYTKNDGGAKLKLDQCMKTRFATIEAFYAAIDAILSLQGFQMLDTMYMQLGAYRSQSLNNFAIDLTTKKLAVISSEITSAYETASYMYIDDEISQNQRYRYVCDEITDDVIPPRLDPAFIAKCIALQPAVLSRTIDAESFFQALGLSFDIAYLDYTTNFVGKLPQNIMPVQQFRFFQPLNVQPDDYVNEVNETVTLQLLREMTGKPFTGNIRKNPSHVVDAFYRCATPDETLEMQLSLHKMKIQTQHYVNADGMNFVCVPGINVGQKARRIADANNAVFNKSNRV